MPTQWYSVSCGGPRVRGLDDGTFEIEGMGVPVYSINKNVIGFAGPIWRYAAQYGVPPQIVAGVMMRESGGNQRAKAADGGMGLMQITYPPLKEGHSDQELLDNAELNIELGTKYLGRLWSQFDGNPIAVLTSYNAGGVKCAAGRNPWNLINTSDYVGGTLSMVNGAAKSGVFGPGADPNVRQPDAVESQPTMDEQALKRMRLVQFAVGTAAGAALYLWWSQTRQAKKFATSFARAASW